MQFVDQRPLWVSGTDDYARYRIPALVTTTANTVLAFCEARKFTGSDTDQIDLYVRRSTDNGRNFDPPILVATEPHWVCGNPAPVVDRETGTTWLLFCKNRDDGDERQICEGKAPRTVWATHSDDDGVTWAEPEEITSQVKPDEWSWYATGPCHGIQLESGRLLIPCDHIEKRNLERLDPYYSHVIYSDDHGHSWKVGGQADEGTNESTIVETSDGAVCFNCRNKKTIELPDGGHFRGICWSDDGGESFSPIVHDAALPEPICQGSILRIPDLGDGRSRTLFSNPGTRSGRSHLTVRLSYDDCRTWPVARTLWRGPAAYSDLCVTADGHILCLYEASNHAAANPYARLTLARFNLEWLTGGADAAPTGGSHEDH